METIIIELEDKGKSNKIKQILKEMKVPYEIRSEKEEITEYNPQFVEKILRRAKNAQKGNTIPYDENLKKELFGL